METARPELVEGSVSTSLCYVLRSNASQVRQAHHERKLLNYTTIAQSPYKTLLNQPLDCRLKYFWHQKSVH